MLPSDRSIVAWIVGIRQFDGGGILYDEHGRALGYAGFDACLGECPRIENMPEQLADLDTFEVSPGPSPDRIEVGARIPGAQRPRAATWLSAHRPDAREEDLRARLVLATPTTELERVAELSDERYAVVAGEVIRSTGAPPMLCKPRRLADCGECVGRGIPIAGWETDVAAHVHGREWWRSPSEYGRSKRATYLEAFSGTFVVQKRGLDLVIVAVAGGGNCSGSVDPDAARR